MNEKMKESKNERMNEKMKKMKESKNEIMNEKMKK
jgi:hypothetical protein